MPPTTRLQTVRDVLGHGFRDPRLLLRACTHASMVDANAPAAERLEAANERLEFLGDTLLGAAVGETLFHRHPTASEGRMSRWRARLGSRATLARAMEQHALLAVCRVGEQVPTPWPDSVKANLAESILAAIYLDGGWEPLRTAVARLLQDFYDDVDTAPRADVKNQLQQWALARFQELPAYHSERSGGSDHAPEFTCRVSVDSHRAEGRGSSRRRAEAAAAAALLARLDTAAGPGGPPPTAQGL